MANRDGGLSVDFQEFIYARQDKLLPNRLSKEYAKAREEAIEHLKAIRDKLAPEFYTADLKELAGLENAHSLMEAKAMELSYKQGFSDGIRIITQSLAVVGLNLGGGKDARQDS